MGHVRPHQLSIRPRFLSGMNPIVWDLRCDFLPPSIIRPFGHFEEILTSFSIPRLPQRWRGQRQGLQTRKTRKCCGGYRRLDKTLRSLFRLRRRPNPGSALPALTSSRRSACAGSSESDPALHGASVVAGSPKAPAGARFSHAGPILAKGSPPPAPWYAWTRFCGDCAARWSRSRWNRPRRSRAGLRPRAAPAGRSTRRGDRCPGVRAGGRFPLRPAQTRPGRSSAGGWELGSPGSRNRRPPGQRRSNPAAAGARA